LKAPSPQLEIKLTLRLVESLETEQERILSAIAGEESAKAWVVSHYTGPIYRYCNRMLRSREDASELAQEVLLRAFRALHRYDPDRSFKTWIFSIARNACIDFHRRKRPTVTDEKVVLTHPGESPQAEVIRKERARRITIALDSLQDPYREIIILYHYEHLKYQEIADCLDIPLGTVMNRIFRARQKLRTAFGDEA
jgi:RNA polymerase sigma-70 factor (ECF subfamily)